MGRRHARPHRCQGGRGNRSTTTQTRHPETPKTAESLLPPWPIPKVSFPRWEKGDKKERTLRPRGPGWHPRLRLPLLGVLGSPARLLGLSPPSDQWGLRGGAVWSQPCRGQRFTCKLRKGPCARQIHCPHHHPPALFVNTG